MLFESLMSARDRERAALVKQRAAAADAVNRALRRRALSRPRWRWADAGFSSAVAGRPEFVLSGRALLRAAARAVV